MDIKMDMRVKTKMRLWKYDENDNVVIVDFDSEEKERVKELMKQKGPQGDQTKLQQLNVIHLNKTGSYIWELADGHKTVAEIIDAVAEEFENEDREQVTQDVMEFLGEMVELGEIKIW
jgi:head-tail adaptor